MRSRCLALDGDSFYVQWLGILYKDTAHGCLFFLTLAYHLTD